MIDQCDTLGLMGFTYTCTSLSLARIFPTRFLLSSVLCISCPTLPLSKPLPPPLYFNNPQLKPTQHCWLLVPCLVQTFSSDTCCIISEKCWKQSNLKNFQLEASITQYFLAESNQLWDWSFKYFWHESQLKFSNWKHQSLEISSWKHPYFAIGNNQFRQSTIQTNSTSLTSRSLSGSNF